MASRTGSELDALEHVGEEALHHDALRDLALDAAAHQVEEQLAIDRARPWRRACSARRWCRSRGPGWSPRGPAATAGGCGSPGTRRCAGRLATRMTPRQTARDSSASTPLKARSTGGVRRVVLLRRVEIEMLVAVHDVRAGQAHPSSPGRRGGLHARLARPRAERRGGPLSARVARDLGPVVREVERVQVAVLHRHVLDVGVGAHGQLDDAVRVARQALDVLLDEREARRLLGHHEQAPVLRAARRRRARRPRAAAAPRARPAARRPARRRTTARRSRPRTSRRCPRWCPGTAPPAPDARRPPTPGW